MADTGWLNPGSVASDASDGATDWTDPNYAQTEDTDSARTGTFGPLGSPTYWLVATQFAAAIPTGAAIDGVEFRVVKKCDVGQVEDFRVYLVVDAVIGGSSQENNAEAGGWPTSEDEFFYGGPAALWSETVDEAKVESSAFGVAIQAQQPIMEIGDEGYIDVIQMKVYYTEAGASSNSGSFFDLF